MNKNWLKNNSNFSPSIRKLRNRRILDQQTQSIQSTVVENDQIEVESDNTLASQDCPRFSLMQNLEENIIISSESGSSSNENSDSDSDSSIISTDSEHDEQDEQFYGELSDELNKLSLENKDFFITQTKRGGLKLCSLGYYYTKERLIKNSNKYHTIAHNWT